MGDILRPLDSLPQRLVAHQAIEAVQAVEISKPGVLRSKTTQQCIMTDDWSQRRKTKGRERKRKGA